jgi:hypothetical protein
VVVRLLPPSTGDVVAEDATPATSLVEPGEERHDHQALQRHGEVAPDHLGQAVRLPFQRQPVSLDLLVVLQLGLEQPNDFRGLAGGAGDGHRAGLVRRKDLVDALVGDGEALGGATVPRHHDSVGERERQDRRPVNRPRAGHGGISSRRLERLLRRPVRVAFGRLHQVDEARVALQRVRGAGERAVLAGHSPPFWT